jgi:hypothetical protein
MDQLQRRSTRTSWMPMSEHSWGMDRSVHGIGEMQRRLVAWHDRGRRPVEDMFEYHFAFGEERWFHTEHARARLQPTWSQLARVVLAARGRPTQRDDVREYQASELGRATGANAMRKNFESV